MVKIPDPYHKKTVFLDRDGVINHLIYHNGQYTAPWCFEEFELIGGVVEAIDLFKKSGYNIYVVTNQPDIYDGKLDPKDLARMHIYLKKIGVDKILHALERGSAWYKPNNGMVEYFINKYKVDRSQSYMIGDTWKDIVAGHKSYLTTIFVGEEYVYPFEHKDKQPDFIVNSALEAATLIEEMNKE